MVNTDTTITGTPESATALLTDLYVRLRRDLQRWASVTQQTPQPRMGYVGQHLVSVVTGFPGGRSGARGDDLKMPDGQVGEIKCCYRVDQLGKCRICGTAVASIESRCPNPTCGSSDLERKDDSKWLLTPKNEQELRELFNPKLYYLVLFEFVDISTAEDIDVLIFEVNPLNLGFSLCMIDYYFNIRQGNPNAAPFNLWPHDMKFCMMKPRMIYRSIIRQDDSIETRLFPGRDRSILYCLDDLSNYSRSRTLSEDILDCFLKSRQISLSTSNLAKSPSTRKAQKLSLLQEIRSRENWDEEELADDFARAVFKDKLNNYREWTEEFAPTL